MKKLSASLLFVTLALVVLNIATLRELSRVDKHVATLEQEMAALKNSRFSHFSEEMALTQRWFDKVGRAGAAQNWALASFYADALQVNVEEMIASKVVTDGQEMSSLLKSTLFPVLQDLKKTIVAGDAAAFTPRYNALLSTCNSCHAATGRAFVVIASPTSQQIWPQMFETKH